MTEWLARVTLHTRLREGLLKLAIGCVFAMVFVLVDRLTYIHPIRDLNITPWNPPAALEVAFLYWGGTVWMGWLYLTLCVSDAVVRETPWLSDVMLLGNAVMVTCYGAIALSLRWALGLQIRLRARRDIARLGVIVCLGALITALSYVSTLTWLGHLNPSDWLAAVHRFFVGDLLGEMVFLPLFFVACDRRRAHEYKAMFSSVWFWLFSVSLLLCMDLIFSLPIQDQMKYFFILFFLLGLVSATYALPGATFAAMLIQISLVYSVFRQGEAPSALMDMQFVMLTLSLTGLIIGTVVDERLRTQERLRDSMQLIAVGQLAGALAHELHQPMSAVSAYAESALMLAPADSRLNEVLQKVLSETMRATDIVRGLRSYFTSGASRPQCTLLSELVASCMQRVTAQAEAKKVQLIQNNRHHGDNVFIDPVQISAALGNLLKNAIEVSLPQSSVEVRLTDGDEGFVSVEVLDQALPLLPQEIEKVFKPFYSQKKEGLGLGLSLSQALVEHNGGVLRYNAQPEKSFQILLPTRES